MAVRYQIRLPDPAQARGNEPTLSFHAHGADAFAEQLQDALRTTALFERWRALQPEPDEVPEALGVTDPDARVSGEQRDLAINLVAAIVVIAAVRLPALPYAAPEKEPIFEDHDLIMLVLLAGIALRSAVWSALQAALAARLDLLLAMAIAAAIGKILGGARTELQSLVDSETTGRRFAA